MGRQFMTLRYFFVDIKKTAHSFHKKHIKKPEDPLWIDLCYDTQEF